MIRAHSSRFPYRRGGLVFDASCARDAAGRAVIEIDSIIAHRIGEDGFRQLLTDPVIELQFPVAPGWRGKVDAAEALDDQKPSEGTAPAPELASSGAEIPEGGSGQVPAPTQAEADAKATPAPETRSPARGTPSKPSKAKTKTRPARPNPGA
jgi:hypothetical protein